MNIKSFLFVVLLALSSCSTNNLNQTDLELQASNITQQFVSTLLPTLQEALSSAGPVNAIEVCSVRAPEIADELSATTSWSVRRVSLRARNSERAIPDLWEQAVLEGFDDRQQAGATMDTLNYSEVIDGEFRYMQAQVTMPLCLTCHGSDLAPDVSAALKEHYPRDLATGYAEGDVRGAISLRYQLK